MISPRHRLTCKSRIECGWRSGRDTSGQRCFPRPRGDTNFSTTENWTLHKYINTSHTIKEFAALQAPCWQYPAQSQCGHSSFPQLYSIAVTDLTGISGL